MGDLTSNSYIMPVKFLKSGKVVIVLAGRRAGAQAAIVRVNEKGTKAYPFPHAVVAGLDKYPGKISKKHSQKKLAKRTQIKSFIKVVNFQHLLPTRYSLADLEFKAVVPRTSPRLIPSPR